MLFWEIHDLVWEIIHVSENRMKNCIVKIIDIDLEKNDEGGLFWYLSSWSTYTTSLMHKFCQ